MLIIITAMHSPPMFEAIKQKSKITNYFDRERPSSSHCVAGNQLWSNFTRDSLNSLKLIPMLTNYLPCLLSSCVVCCVVVAHIFVGLNTQRARCPHTLVFSCALSHTNINALWSTQKHTYSDSPRTIT